MEKNGKEYEKNVCVNTYIYMSLCYTAEMKYNNVNQLYFYKIKKKYF